LSPDTVINEVMAEFGQLVGQRTKIEELFWNAVWEIEALLRPPHTQTEATFPVTDAGPYGEIDMSTAGDVYDILSVTNGSFRLVRVSLNGISNQPSWVQTASLYAWDPATKKILINKGTSALPSGLTVFFSSKSIPVASAVDVPWLAELYPQVLLLTRLKAAELTGDTSKIQEILSSSQMLTLGRVRS